MRDLAGVPRWTEPDRWHLTLLFLGVVPEERVAPLVAAAGSAVAAAPAMTLRLAGGGHFGSTRRPQVAWTGVDGDLAPLVALAVRLTDAAAGLGLPVEDRPFRPHLTVGRWRPREPADGTLTDRLAAYGGPAWPVIEVRLVESRPGPKPTYEALASWPVGQQA